MVSVCAFDVPPPGFELKTVTGAVPVAAMSAAGIAAVSCVAETNAVARFTPFQRTAEVETNPVPLTVRVKAGPPAVTADGLSPVIVGTGLFAVKICAFDVPPPGAALKTVTDGVPAAAMSAAGIVAVSWPAERNVVVRFAPFQRTTEVGTNPVPFNVSVNAVPPADDDAGFNPVVAGAGLLIARACALEVPPPGAVLSTVTVAVPAAAMSLAEIAAVNWLLDTNVVVRFAPFQRTTEVETKPVPFTVRVNGGPPAATDVGLSAVVVGTGLFTVKVCAFDVPPPGADVNTVTDAEPAVAMSAAAMVAVSWPAETNVVGRSTPFQRTVDVGAKLVPLTVRVKVD